MKPTLSLAVTALASILLIAGVTIYLSSGETTGLFIESNGYCADTIGGVTTYRYCDQSVDPVWNVVQFKKSGFHQQAMISDDQTIPRFPLSSETKRHVLIPSSPTFAPVFVGAQDLGSQPFDRLTWASRRTLRDDPIPDSSPVPRWDPYEDSVE